MQDRRRLQLVAAADLIHALVRSPIFRLFHSHGIGVGTPVRRFQFLPCAKDDLAKQAADVLLLWASFIN